MTERQNYFGLLAVLALSAVLLSVFRPRFIRARSRLGPNGMCKIHLKNMGTALEEYSMDHEGKYPSTLSALVPKYLKTLPECDTSGPGSYRMITGPGVGYNRGAVREDGSRSEPFPDYYLIWCEGDQHHRATDIPINYPQYDGISGLMER